MPARSALLALPLAVILPLAIAEAQVPLTLPDVPSSTRSSSMLEVRLRDDLSALVGGEVVGSDDLIAAIGRKTGGDRTTRILLGARRSSDYRKVIDVLKRLNEAGYHSVALIALP